MAQLAMPVRKPAPPARMPREATPQQIIATAREAPAGMRSALAMSGTTAILLWGAFTPLDFGPLAWVALVPLLLLARLPRPTESMYRSVYLGGLVYWLVTLQWMRLGHDAMYIALGALSIYLACYFPLFLWLSRVAVWNLRIPLMLAAPTIWVGLEWLRGQLMTGFGWYYLGHSQYRWAELIQISDLVGAYGVSFLPALIGACVVELVPARAFGWMRLLPEFATEAAARDLSNAGRLWRAALCLALFGGALGYGYWKRGHEPFQPGLRVALIQGNVPSSVKHDQGDFPRIQRQHENLTGRAVKEQPDLIVWPETMFRWPLLVTPPDVSDEELQAAHPELPLGWLRDLRVRTRLAQLSQMAGAAMIVGLETYDVDLKSIRNYNSAAFLRPDGTLAGRYDKLHRVVFGEYIPFADVFPWLHRVTPFGSNFGIDAGREAAVFEHRGSYFAPIICFEDTVPHLVRDLVNATTRETSEGPRRVDFLVNLTNDGWFHGSSELDQHLITAAFRAVECRTPVIRAVNTGISAIIDGDGVIRSRAKGLKTGSSKQEEAVLVEHVPLDTRPSPYLRHGDWFAESCLVCCGFFSLMGLYGRFAPRATTREGANSAIRHGDETPVAGVHERLD
jgi:apolipoprotein N-acyltransferase